VTTVELSRKNLLAILAGFVVIILIGIITGAFSFFINATMAHTLSVQDFKSTSTSMPYLAVSWLLKILSFLSPIIGGFVVGRLVKNKEWLYGGLLGVILSATSIAIVSLTFVLPTSFMYSNQFPAGYEQSLAQNNIVNQLLHPPIIILLTGLGGYLSDVLYKKNRKKK